MSSVRSRVRARHPERFKGYQWSSLEVRKTHQYRDGWAYLDQWQDVCPVKLYRVEEDVIRLRLPWKLPRVLLVEAIRDSFSGSSCRHEQDCCGCRLTSVDEVYVGRKGRTATVLLRHSYYL